MPKELTPLERLKAADSDYQAKLTTFNNLKDAYSKSLTDEHNRHTAAKESIDATHKLAYESSQNNMKIALNSNDSALIVNTKALHQPIAQAYSNAEAHEINTHKHNIKQSDDTYAIACREAEIALSIAEQELETARVLVYASGGTS